MFPKERGHFVGGYTSESGIVNELHLCCLKSCIYSFIIFNQHDIILFVEHFCPCVANKSHVLATNILQGTVV
jgi:hypothetical protein